MTTVTLSYVLSTKNKLPFLREVLSHLTAHCLPDEEIIVADGGSSDGTVEYLEQMLLEKKIHVFLHGPDTGEAHGFNKAIVASSGALIKLITDDDAFYYGGIQKCKEFMLEHPEIDFLSTDGVKRRLHTSYPYSPMMYQSQFEKRQKKHAPFAFCGLGIMLRKSSLPILGLLHTGFTRVDAEYSLRVTASRANIAWYTQECFAHIRNEHSNSVLQERKITGEMDQLEALYLGKSQKTTPEKMLRDIARHVKDWFRNKKNSIVSKKPEAHILLEEWIGMYQTSVKYLEENAAGNNGEFLY